MKTTVSKKTSKPAVAPIAKESDPGVRVVKTAQCSSLSGKSDLAYEFGLTDVGALRLRITANTGKGSFRQEWIDVGAIKTALDKPARSETITSDCLVPLFRKESANMPTFVFAVLLREGLVRPSEKSKRRYDRAEPTAVDAILKALAEGKGAAEKRTVKGKVAKTTVAKPKKDKKSPNVP